MLPTAPVNGIGWFPIGSSSTSAMVAVVVEQKRFHPSHCPDHVAKLTDTPLRSSPTLLLLLFKFIKKRGQFVIYS